jgi:hypothetical protein
MKTVRDNPSIHPIISSLSGQAMEAPTKQSYGFVQFIRSSPLIGSTIVIERLDSPVRELEVV